MEAFGLRALPADARDPLRLAFNVPGVSQSTGFFGDARPLVIHGDNALYTARDGGGGVIVPEADITTRRIGSLTSLTHRTAFRSGRASNELSSSGPTATPW